MQIGASVKVYRNTRQGPLAGLVAVCAGSDLMHPLGALAVGAVAGTIFVLMFTLTQNRWKIDAVLGVGWALLGGAVVYGALKAAAGLRLSQEEGHEGADLSIHRIGATPQREVNW